MNVAKILLLGTWLASFGTIAYLYMMIYRRLPPQTAVGVDVFRVYTISNPLWWAGLVVCFALSYIIVRAWSGNVVFWAFLVITELIPVGLLTLFLVMVSRLRQANDAIK